MDEPLRSSEPSVDGRGITPPPAFRVDVLPSPAGTLVLKLVGEHDLAASTGFRERVEAALGDGACNVVIDMEETTFIDSSMLKELLRANAAAAEAGGRMGVTAGAAPAERLAPAPPP